jgi:UDP-N-acetylmuramoyl-tripeptide--D-alanyl-D-alanine ligase
MTDSHPIPWTMREIQEATDGEMLCGEFQQSFTDVFIDSRNLSSSGVFVAIVGEVHDGHKFLADVVTRGVQGLVVNRGNAADLPLADWEQKGIACLAVDDTTRALGALAAFNRWRSNASVVGITGSNGKTTTRQMIASVVSQQYRTLATTGNLNNQIGLPLTLLKLEPNHQWAVLELGTNYPGEIARLAQICEPDIGVITNIGPAHLEGLGSIEGVAREKGSLLQNMRPNGKAVLNADDPRVLKLADRVKTEALLYGLSPDAAVQATDIAEGEDGSGFTLHLAGDAISIRLITPGRFMVSNALAAAAVGKLLKLSLNQIKAGLERFTPVSGRMTILHPENGIHIIDDSYNANPESMKAALASLQKLCAGSRGVFVAGDMLELGQQASSLHREIGGLAAKIGVDRLYARGEFADQVTSGACDAGLPPEDAITGSRKEIIADLTNWLKPGDWVLVKGSRGMAMEKVVEGLKAWTAKGRS